MGTSAQKRRLHEAKLFDMFHTTDMTTNDIILTVTLVVMAVTMWLVFYYFMLPIILKGIAETGRFIAHLEENGIVFVVAGKRQNGKFVEAITGSKLFHLPDPEEADCAIVDSPPPDNHATGYKHWLIKRGYTWIGFYNHSAILTITKTRKSADTTKKIPIAQLVEYLPNQIITYLKREFVLYVKIDNIETDDAFEVTMVVLAHVKVIFPYRTWFGKGSKAYETIFTEVEITVRELVEAMTLDYMYRGGPKPGSTTTPPEESNGIADLKAKLKSGIPDAGRVKRVKDELGVEVPQIEIVDWDNDAPPSFHEGVQAVTLEQQTRAGMLQKQLTRQTVAKEEVRSLGEEKLAAAALAEKNEKVREAILKLSGGVKSGRLTEILTMQSQLTEASFNTYLKQRAFELTGVQVLGGSTMDLLGIVMAKEKPEVKAEPKEGKEKK